MPPKAQKRTPPLRTLITGRETTQLSPADERDYQRWISHYALPDIDPATREPYDDVRYDLRGYWQKYRAPGMAGFGPPQFPGAHGPDTFKQHGHPTFSQESQYSRGPWDGGMWIPGSEVLLEQPPMAVSHKRTK